jgi:hypothetical protein
MRLFAVRHGRPAWHSPRLISLAAFERLSAGYDDAHLSQDGARAVAALAEQVPKVPILSSDLPRARERAEAIANTTTPFLGLTLGSTMQGAAFLSLGTVKVLLLGLVAFALDNIGGILFGKLL